METGVDGLLRDKTRKPAKRQSRDRRRAAGRTDPGRAAGRDDALDQPGDGEGQRHGDQHGPEDLARSRPGAASAAHLKLSRDPAFASRVRDVVGLYVDPPAHAVVLAVDEKSRIQALDRTQPGCR